MSANLKLSSRAIQVQPKRPQPLAQVELVVSFSPALQSGGMDIPAEKIAQGRSMWLTVDVFGRIAKGELTGKPVVEDMRLEHGGEDISEQLEPLADAISDYVAGDL